MLNPFFIYLVSQPSLLLLRLSIQLTKAHRQGHMVKVDWLDRLTFREIEMINEVSWFQNRFCLFCGKGHSDPDWNMSTNVSLIALTFCSEIHGAQRINADFVDPLVPLL